MTETTAPPESLVLKDRRNVLGAMGGLASGFAFLPVRLEVMGLDILHDSVGLAVIAWISWRVRSILPTHRLFWATIVPLAYTFLDLIVGVKNVATDARDVISPSEPGPFLREMGLDAPAELIAAFAVLGILFGILGWAALDLCEEIRRRTGQGTSVSRAWKYAFASLILLTTITLVGPYVGGWGANTPESAVRRGVLAGLFLLQWGIVIANLLTARISLRAETTEPNPNVRRI